MPYFHPLNHSLTLFFPPPLLTSSFIHRLILKRSASKLEQSNSKLLNCATTTTVCCRAPRVLNIGAKLPSQQKAKFQFIRFDILVCL